MTMIHTGSVLALLGLSFLLPDVAGDEHSLYYLYTVQSKSSTDRVSEFSAVTLLNDRQIDSYSSTDGIRTPKQDWMKEMKEREWKEGTDKLKYDGQQLNKILNIQMKDFRHDESDGHSLQWRVGCEVENYSGGSVLVLNCINEYGYDGQSLVSYNWTLKKWSASVSEAKEMEEEWNAGRGQNPVQRCQECVEWLKIYLQYNSTENKQTRVDVYVFVKKSVTDLKKLTLTCLATGFYPKDVVVSLRKFTTSMPEHLLTSSGVRPNDDGTYQLRKSVEIQEDDTADYYCYVNHSSIGEPVIKKWDGKCSNCQNGPRRKVIVGVIVGATLALVVIGTAAQIFWVLKSERERERRRPEDVETPMMNGAPPTQSGGAGDVQAEPVNLQPDDVETPMMNGAPPTQSGSTAGDPDAESDVETPMMNGAPPTQSGGAGDVQAEPVNLQPGDGETPMVNGAPPTQSGSTAGDPDAESDVETPMVNGAPPTQSGGAGDVQAEPVNLQPGGSTADSPVADSGCAGEVQAKHLQMMDGQTVDTQTLIVKKMWTLFCSVSTHWTLKYQDKYHTEDQTLQRA